MSNDKNVKRFFNSVSMYYKTFSNRTDFDNDSECSPQEEQQKIKQEVERDAYDTQTDR